jgi:hypothetical protein
MAKENDKKRSPPPKERKEDRQGEAPTRDPFPTDDGEDPYDLPQRRG